MTGCEMYNLYDFVEPTHIKPEVHQGIILPKVVSISKIT
jgi:hypothetical protein